MSIHYKDLLAPYSPWAVDGTPVPWKDIPSFRRPIYEELKHDLEKLPQIISVMGPRRIGKTTLLKQLIQFLLEEERAPRDKIIYYSLDDPGLARIEGGAEAVIETLLNDWSKSSQEPAYLFLDEIHRWPKWELYLKKFYDLKYPVRFVISGSASSPIFKKSRESLLGRVKDFHLYPFSYREFLLYDLRHEPSVISEIVSMHEQGRVMQEIAGGGWGSHAEKVHVIPPNDSLKPLLQASLDKFFLEGGFPEVWALEGWVSKQDYLFDNQVKKVIYEDLVLAAEFRKPELLKRFYISLLEMPGREVNIQDMAGEIRISRKQIEKYLPLLEMTDLITHVPKFRKSPLRVRQGKMKFYLVDLALRNAVLRLTDTLLQDSASLGHYAENLVCMALKKWRAAIQMDYFREDKLGEVDFIVHTGPKNLWPIEVKYQNSISRSDLLGLRYFVKKFGVQLTPLVVSKRWTDFGERDGFFFIPLPLFLLMFD